MKYVSRTQRNRTEDAFVKPHFQFSSCKSKQQREEVHNHSKLPMTMTFPFKSICNPSSLFDISDDESFRHLCSLVESPKGAIRRHSLDWTVASDTTTSDPYSPIPVDDHHPFNVKDLHEWIQGAGDKFLFDGFINPNEMTLFPTPHSKNRQMQKPMPSPYEDATVAHPKAKKHMLFENLRNQEDTSPPRKKSRVHYEESFQSSHPSAGLMRSDDKKRVPTPHPKKRRAQYDTPHPSKIQRKDGPDFRGFKTGYSTPDTDDWDWDPDSLLLHTDRVHGLPRMAYLPEFVLHRPNQTPMSMITSATPKSQASKPPRPPKSAPPSGYGSLFSPLGRRSARILDSPTPVTKLRYTSTTSPLTRNSASEKNKHTKVKSAKRVGFSGASTEKGVIFDKENQRTPNDRQHQSPYNLRKSVI